MNEMHPSNYAHLYRKRNSHQVNTERTSTFPIPQENLQKNCHCRRASDSDIPDSLEFNEWQNFENCSKNGPFLVNSSKRKTGSHGNISLSHNKLSNMDNSGLNIAIHPCVAAGNPPPSKAQQLHSSDKQQHQEYDRRRSGSWSGVQESDEDVEKLVNDVLPPYCQIGLNSDVSLTSSAGGVVAEGGYLCSYQDSSSCNSTVGTTNTDLYIDEDKMRKRLRFFFMNPIEKWRAKRRFPWKLLIQIVKIVIVTSQLSMFASQRYNHVSYLSDTKVSFSHLFVKGWDASREVDSYPPSSGPLSLYKIEDFYSFLDYSIVMFSKIERTALGTYKFHRNKNVVNMPVFCFSEFRNCSIDLYNLSFTLNKDIVKHCVSIPQSMLNNTSSWSIQNYLNETDQNINFDILLDATLSFQLRTIKLTVDLPFDSPECYQLQYSISFNNQDHDGQMLIESEVNADVLQCEGFVDSVDETYRYNSIRSGLNILTIIICFMSFLMCLRSILRAQQIKQVTCKFFRSHFGRHLTNWELFEFTNLWYVLICVNDILIISGSVIKMALEGEDYEGYLDRWNICSLFLGTGNLLVWFGCLRYLCFFETYNVMILTIKSCFPNVFRYSICILMVFAGYSFCGWLVLGPYNLKFRSLSSTVECLYSLINGDDMFATFAMTAKKDVLIWWFSRIYLYSFVSLFIYVILSLFIAIIMDAYETIKKYYESGFPMCDLRRFAYECRADLDSDAFRDDQDTTIQDLFNSIFCCCSQRGHRRSPQGYEPLPS